MPDYLVNALLSVFTPVLLALAALIAARVELWIRRNVQHAELQGLLLRATEAANVAAVEVAQTFVDGIKRNSEDGRLSKLDALDALTKAKSRARLYLGPEGLAIARRVLGDDDHAIDAWLTALIEREVRRLKEA